MSDHELRTFTSTNTGAVVALCVCGWFSPPVHCRYETVSENGRVSVRNDRDLGEREARVYLNDHCSSSVSVA